MRRLTGAAMAAAALLLATGAAAQDTNGLERSRTSIVVGATGDITVGVWQRLSPRTSLGLEVGAYSRNGEYRFPTTGQEQETEERLVTVGPALKVYTGPGGAFLPYGYASAFAQFGSMRHQPLDGEAQESDVSGFGGQVGVGVDWFPVQRVSIGGHVGVEGFSSSRDAVAFNGEEEFTGIGTFSSGIRVQLYF
jgi:hypothetical protein